MNRLCVPTLKGKDQRNVLGDGADATNAGGAKSRTETIHKRIGFEPAPKN